MTTKFKRRALILNEANRLFCDKGFSATTLEDIAAAVGIKRESLYYYYPGRYDILYDIIEPQIARVMMNFEAIIVAEPDIAQAIRCGVKNHLQQFNPSYLHMAMAIRKNSSDKVQQKFIQLHTMFKAYEQVWVGLLRRGCACGAVRSDTPPAMLVYSILGLCNSLSSWYRPDGDMTLDQIGSYYSDIILDGISVR